MFNPMSKKIFTILHSKILFVLTYVTEADDVDGEVTFESIPKTELLDTSANRSKAQLASAMPSRRPPTKQRSKVRYSNSYNPGYIIPIILGT